MRQKKKKFFSFSFLNRSLLVTLTLIKKNKKKSKQLLEKEKVLRRASKLSFQRNKSNFQIITEKITFQSFLNF